MRNSGNYTTIALSVLFIFIGALRPSAAEAVTASYLYDLSTFTGKVHSSWARVSVDREHNEIYVINLSDLSVRVFNEAGMEIYNFDGVQEQDIGVIYDATVVTGGNIVMLAYSYRTRKSSIYLCNFRGEVLSKIKLKNLPPAISGPFFPTAVVHRDGRLYFLDKSALHLVVTDVNGVFERYYDLASLFGLEKTDDLDLDIYGFDVDREGNMLFTIPVFFKAYKLLPDGKVTSFGQKGSAPGKFNVVSGITSDDRGNYYVADMLKCAVMVFDKEFRFLTQVGYRGFGPGGLIAPRDLAVHEDKIYVTQSAEKGVSVFRVNFN